VLGFQSGLSAERFVGSVSARYTLTYGK